MDLFNDFVTASYGDDYWALDVYVNIKTLKISAEIEIGDGSFRETTVDDAIELGIWLWYQGAVGKEADLAVEETEAAQLWAVSCS